MVNVYLSLGSNLGKKGENLQKALVDLERWGVKIIRSSKIYKTEPVGKKDQPWFYNMAVLAETGLSPEELLKAATMIELSLGRIKTVKWGPRPIDIDILFYGDSVIKKPGLEIPHPRLADRRFVLKPLAEIAPAVVHPLLKKTFKQLLKDCVDTAIVDEL
jgi:2-amino-4-hydroxy-6-hydroxymethyldihydropteridine diphosphokinase